MKRLLLATCIASYPVLSIAAPLCGLPVSMESRPSEPVAPHIALPPPVPGASVQAQPVSGPAAPGSASVTVPPAASASAPPAELPGLGVPVLRHVSASGAAIEDLGVRNGLRTVVARSNGEFMLLSVAPSGDAMVAGIPADLSVARLRAIAGSGLTELGERHGLQGLMVRNGDAFQVFYATPTGEQVIPGVMWDATGKNLTREQVSSVEGAIPTVTIGDVPTGRAPVGAVPPPRPNTQAASAPVPAQPPGALAVADRASAGTVGNAGAPHLWMFADPQCGYSVQAMQRLWPLVASGKVRLSVIPVAILDHQNAGHSTTDSLAMLSKPADQMVAAWSRGNLQGAADAEAAPRLRTNMEAAQAIRLRGTPTLLWRRADGSEGRSDGMPNDIDALVASMQGS